MSLRLATTRLRLAASKWRAQQLRLQARAMGSGPDPWNYLWAPGPYPKTPEERAAAAKKYVSGLTLGVSMALV